MKSIVFSALTAITLLGASWSAAVGLPAELKHLEALESSPAELIDAARRFHLQQQSLISWDQRLIGEYGKSGQGELAAEKQRELVHRVDLLQAQWEWILERYPNDARANNYYGEYLYDYAGDQVDAVRHWKTAIGLDPKCAPAHNNLGILYFHEGEYREGLSHLQRALSLEPNNPDYLFNMAQMYLTHFDTLEKMLSTPREKLYTEAMKMSGKAAELAPEDFDLLQDYAVNFFAAENFGITPDWEAAAAAWHAALPHARTEDERFYALLNEGRSWIRAARPQNAVQPLQDALSVKKDSAIAEKLLAEARGQSQ